MTVRGRFARLSPRRINFLPEVRSEPEQKLPPSEIQRGMRLSITEGIFAQYWGVVTVGSFVTGLALVLGADDFALGLIAALPVASQFVQLFAAWWVERRGNRRFITVLTSMGRLFWIIPPLLLFVPMDPVPRLGLAILSMALSFGIMAICSNAWLNWMSDLIPASLRGRFFATRNTVVAIFSMITIWGGGTLLDYTRSQHAIDTGYMILYGGACVASIISSAIVARQPEPPMRPAPRQNIGKLLTTPLRDGRFRLFILNFCVWGIFLNLSSPFFAAQALKNLHMSYQELATFDVITNAVAIVCQLYWGRLADRLGNKTVLAIGMIGAAPLAGSWVITTPDSIWILYVNAALAGLFWPGANLALGNRLMERAPAEGRSSYLASYSAITGITAFLASLLGGLLVDLAAGTVIQLGPIDLNNYKLIFLVSAIGRVAVALIGRRNL